MRKHIWPFIILTIGLLIAATAYYSYPKTTLVVAAPRSAIDSDGKLTGKYKEIQDYLGRNGVTLLFKSAPDDFSEKPPIELALKDPDIDWVIVSNTGAKISPEHQKQFESLGVIRRIPIYFYRRVDDRTTTQIHHLVHKRIVINSPPEGRVRTTFYGGAESSSFSDEWILMRLFDTAFVNALNSTVFNIWPNPISADIIWDVALSTEWPTTKLLWNTDVELFSLDDIAALPIQISNLEIFKVPQSAINVSMNLPSRELAFPAYTQSLVVNKSLDPSLVMLLAEATKKTFSVSSATQARNEFPTFSKPEMFDPHPAAEEFYKNGRPALSNYVSPVMAVFIMKILIVLIPILTVVWPIGHFFPILYSAYVRKKITQWYLDLELIEKNYKTANQPARHRFKERLQEISDGISNLKLPIMHGQYVQGLFIAREHVELIRKKIDEIAGSD